jgi:hypothetical protein
MQGPRMFPFSKQMVKSMGWGGCRENIFIRLIIITKKLSTKFNRNQNEKSDELTWSKLDNNGKGY